MGPSAEAKKIAAERQKRMRAAKEKLEKEELANAARKEKGAEGLSTKRHASTEEPRDAERPLMVKKRMDLLKGQAKIEKQLEDVDKALAARSD